MKKQILASFVLLVVTIIWGLAFVFQDIAGSYLPSFSVSSIRFLFASIALIPVVIFQNRHNKKVYTKENGNNEKKFFTKELMIGGLISGGLLCLGAILQQYGLEFHSVGKTGFITTSYILIIPIISLFFKKYSSWNTYVAVLVAMGGMFLLCTNGGIHFEITDLIIFGSAFAYAFQIMSVNYLVNSKDVDPINLSLVQLFYSFVISTILALIFDLNSGVTFNDIVNALPSLLYIGVISAGIGYTLQNITQKYIPETLAGLIMSLESVFSLLFGLIILQQYLDIFEIIGCIIMFLAVIFAQLPLSKVPKRRKQSEEFTKSEIKEEETNNN
jgi:drug/metabolite transporter (DMT)-like permease